MVQTTVMSQTTELTGTAEIYNSSRKPQAFFKNPGTSKITYSITLGGYGESLFFIVHSSEHNAADTKEGTDGNDKDFFLIRQEKFLKKRCWGLTYMSQIFDITYSINYAAHEFWFESELRLHVHYIKICCATNQ